MKSDWILCSERLPGKDGIYLCTMDGELIGEEQPFTGMCGFYNGKWDEEDCVIAWQELPEPCDITDFFSDKFAQAKEVLKSTLDREEIKYPRVACYCDALALAVEALDKQITERPIFNVKPGGKYEYTYCFKGKWICPNCEAEFETKDGKYKYCPKCGQKINWEGVEHD